MFLFNMAAEFTLWFPLLITGHIINFHHDRFGLLELVATTKHPLKKRLWMRPIPLKAQSLAAPAPASRGPQPSSAPEDSDPGRGQCGGALGATLKLTLPLYGVFYA